MDSICFILLLIIRLFLDTKIPMLKRFYMIWQSLVEVFKTSFDFGKVLVRLSEVSVLCGLVKIVCKFVIDKVLVRLGRIG